MLIGVDTNVLMDYAAGEDDVVDAIETIRKRTKLPRFIVPPTVIHELAALFEKGSEEESDLAAKALTSIQKWKFEPSTLVPAELGIVEQIGLKLRLAGLLPEQEANDGLIIAEAALLGCSMLLSADGHMIEAYEHHKFKKLMQESDVAGDSMIIATPRRIVSRFFRHK